MCGTHTRTRRRLAATRHPASVRDELRASDADRDLAVRRLREHAAAGRLTLDELEQRIDMAHAARVHGDLRRLEVDLPAVRLPEDDVRADARERAALRGHVGQYVAVMLLLVAIWALTGGGYFWPVWPMLGWGIGVLAHALPLLGPRGGGRPPRGHAAAS